MKINTSYPRNWSTTNFERLYYQVKYLCYEFEVEKKDWMDLGLEEILKYVDRYILRYVNKLFRRGREKSSIKIEYHDIWSLDQSLAEIIYPALVMLKKHKHGSPKVEDEDVPERLRSYMAPPKENEWDTDDLYFKRWDWVLDEMIWTFRELAAGGDTPSSYYHNRKQLKMNFVPIGDKGYSQVEFNHQVDPNRPKYFVDRESEKWYHDKIKNGLRLFSTYYRGLWD